MRRSQKEKVHGNSGAQATFPLLKNMLLSVGTGWDGTRRDGTGGRGTGGPVGSSADACRCFVRGIRKPAKQNFFARDCASKFLVPEARPFGTRRNAAREY